MRLLLALLAAVAALFGYYLWWERLAGEMETRLIAEIESAQRQGYVIAHDGIEVRGFPYRLKLEISEPRISRPGHPQQWAYGGDWLWVVVQPWNLTHAILGFEGEQRLDWTEKGEAKNLVLLPELARASMILDETGGIGRYAVDWQNVQVTTPRGEAASIARLQLHGQPEGGASADAGAATGAASAAAANGGGHRLALQIDGLALPPSADGPLGRQVERLGILGRMKGPLTWRELRAEAAADVLARWRDAGGAVEIEKMESRWDVLEVEGNGTLTLDGEMRPLAAFATRMRGQGALLDALARQGLMQKGEAILAKAGLALLSSPDEQGRQTLSAPITAQDGRLMLGPVAVMRLKPLF